MTRQLHRRPDQTGIHALRNCQVLGRTPPPSRNTLRANSRSNSPQLREKTNVLCPGRQPRIRIAGLHRLCSGVPPPQHPVPMRISSSRTRGDCRFVCSAMQGDGPKMGPELSRSIHRFARGPIRPTGRRKPRQRSWCSLRCTDVLRELRSKRYYNAEQYSRSWRMERTGTSFWVTPAGYTG